MATYLPGVQDYIPSLEPFKPDYKFLSDVLTVRQDRYSTNFKALNNLYNDVTNAPLLRDENIQRRDQYVNRLSDGLKQVSGMDLSLQQNVDAAQGLFRPFYEDKDIRKDMAMTKRISDQQKKANFYMQSPNPEDNDKWWQVGVDRLQMHADDFKNATTEGARGMGLPSYVDNPNYFERALDSLKDSGLSFEQTTPYGDWMITDVNGRALTHRVIGYEMEDDNETFKLDEEGERIPVTVDDTFNFLKNTMLVDPKVQLGMQTEAYVTARNFATNPENIAEHGSEDGAYQFWADDYINKAVDAGIMELSEADSLEKSLETDVDAWKDYKEKYNIIPGSPSENIIMQKTFELDLAKKNKDLIQQQVQTLKSPNSDLDKLLSTAYQAYGILTVGPKLKEAGSAYSRQGAKRTFKVNELAKLRKEQEFKWAMEGYKDQNIMNQIKARGIETRLNQEHKAILDAQADGITGSIYDNFKDAQPKAFDFKNYDLTKENIESQEFNLLDKIETDRNNAVNNIDNQTYSFLDLVQSMPDEFIGSPFLEGSSLGSNFKYTVDGNTKTGTLDQMISDLNNPENETELDRVFNHFRDAVSDTLNVGYRSEIPGDLNSPLIEQDILINPSLATLNNKPEAYSSLLTALNNLDVTKGSFVNTEKEYNRILRNLQAENVTDEAVNQLGFPPIIQSKKQKEMALSGESISNILNYNNTDTASFVVVDKETFADEVVAMATNGGDIQGVLDYLNKNHTYAVFSTKAQPNRFTKEYSFNDRDKIDIFEKNPLLAQSFFWEEEPRGEGYPLGLGMDNNPGTWVFAPYATRRTMIGGIFRGDKSNEDKIQALREIAYEVYDGEDDAVNAQGEDRLTEGNTGMIQNLQILMREGDAPGKYSFNYKDFMDGNLPQMGQDVKLDPIMDAYFDNVNAKYEMIDGQRVPTDPTHFILNMSQVLRRNVAGKDWQAYIPEAGESGFGVDINNIINATEDDGTGDGQISNKVMEQMLDYLLMAQKNDTKRSIFDISWSKTGSNEVGADGEYTYTAYKLQPNIQTGSIIQDMLMSIDGYGDVATSDSEISKAVLTSKGVEAYQKIMSNGIVMYMDKNLDQNRNMDASNAVDPLARYIMTSEEPYRMELPNGGVSIIEHIGGGQFKVRSQDYMWNSDSLAIVPQQIIPDQRIYRADQVIDLKAALEQYMINIAKQNIAAENDYKAKN
mgnify:CR=1 FL=1|tara:strand:- start:17693 stop:21280 length:3588 start_codon:yes stop_codon:yes gene_type:complete